MSNKICAQDIIQSSKLIVIKVGSVLVRGKELDAVNTEWMESFAKDIKALKDSGKNVVIVSSGGVALGRKALGISARIAPSAIPLAKKQAASSVGQYHLFNGYFKAFANCGVTAAQVLLTMSETENRRMHLNARETLYTLLESDIVPIINENDTVSTGEIRFGDNDRLSVRVAQMIGADSVVLLSTADGLFTDNPDKNSKAKHIPWVEQITDEHMRMAGDAIAGLSTGGMKSKIEAASSATKTGVNLLITNGRDVGCLNALQKDGGKRSTLFLAQNTDSNARKIWIGAHMSPKGSVVVDGGALSALQNGKSLLPVGVKRIEGDFKRGDVVEILSLQGDKIGMGLSAYNADDARKIIGKNSADIEGVLGYIGRNELIHRNDLVLEV